MRNIFDPFGVLGEWKGQEPEEALSETELITDNVIDDHWGELTEMISAAVSRGMEAERVACLNLMKKHLDTNDPAVKTLVSEILSRNSE